MRTPPIRVAPGGVWGEIERLLGQILAVQRRIGEQIDDLAERTGASPGRGRRARATPTRH